MKTLIALTAGLVVATSLISQGQSVTWNLGGSGGLTSTGVTRSFTVSGVKVTVGAWSYTKGSSNTALEASKLGQYSPGLGVTNNEEDGSSPWHQLDNNYQNDYILFVFDKLVSVANVKVTASPGPYDQDVSYWLGNISNSNLDNVNYTGLASRGFGAEQTVDGVSTSSQRTYSINATPGGVNALLFGPRRGVITTTDKNIVDAFKVNSISATVVPEPSAALLTALGALGFCLRRRR